MQRFFLPPDSFGPDVITIRDANVIHQMMRVLRMKKGDVVVLLDDSAVEWHARIDALSSEQIIALPLKKKKNEAESPITVTLFQAIPKKKELFELILQKGTELGVSTFVPIITESGQSRALPRHDRVIRIMREAAEQCERGRVPTLEKSISFGDAISRGGNKIVFHSRNIDRAITTPAASTLSLFIGPEGGFSEKEVALAKQKGACICSLGPRILRMETAAIAACARVLLP